MPASQRLALPQSQTDECRKKHERPKLGRHCIRQRLGSLSVGGILLESGTWAAPRTRHGLLAMR